MLKRRKPTSYFKEVANAGKTFAGTRFTSSALFSEHTCEVSVTAGGKEPFNVPLVHFVDVFMGLTDHHTGVRRNSKTTAEEELVFFLKYYY